MKKCKYEYWWLSFADADLPKGSQFLGAIIAEGATIIDAIKNTHRLKLNPGGEVQGLKIGIDKVEMTKPYANRLLDRAECERLDILWAKESDK